MKMKWCKKYFKIALMFDLFHPMVIMSERDYINYRTKLSVWLVDDILTYSLSYQLYHCWT